MAERDRPESWLPGKAKEPDNMTRVPSKRQYISKANGSRVSDTGSNSGSLNCLKDKHSEHLPVDSLSRETVPTRENLRKLPKWTKSWVLWTLLLALVPGAIAFFATTMLLKLPSAPNCPSIFWPLASASVRLHCAQLAASKQSLKDLLQAIALVKELPKSHPLRAEIDRFIEEWSEDILDLADQSFQSGRLEEAIETARQVPDEVPAYKLVEERISKWQSIWSKAEEIYQKSEAQLREERWHQAFMVASKLLHLDNKYWATTKYDELNRLIVSAREDGDKLAKARGLAKNGGVKSILEAIKLAESIPQESYVYSKASEAIPEFGRKILQMAEAKLEQRDADEAIALAQKIPTSTKLQLEVEDFIAIAEAQRSSWAGTISG